MRLLLVPIAMLLLTGSTCDMADTTYNEVYKDTEPLGIGRYARTLSVEWVPPTEAIYDIELRGIVYSRPLAIRAYAPASNGLAFDIRSEDKRAPSNLTPFPTLPPASFEQAYVELFPLDCQLHTSCTKTYRIELRVDAVPDHPGPVPGVTFELMFIDESQPLSFNVQPWETL